MMRFTMILLAAMMGVQGVSADIHVIPMPNNVRHVSGDRFVFTEHTQIVAATGLESLAEQLNDALSPAFGFVLPKGSGRNVGSATTVTLKTDSALNRLGQEGYRLTVSSDEISIEAPRPAGIFYGIQTLRQLLPSDVFNRSRVSGVEWAVFPMVIEDRPELKWRGLHLDTTTRFFPVESIKSFIDVMAVHKLNRFHWQLADDKAWRIEIRRYPKLTAWEDQSLVEGFRHPGNRPHVADYYSQEQIRDVVRYAKERFVEIVPGIDMTGQCAAAVSVYPALSCTGVNVRGEWDVYCVGKEDAFEFHQNVLTEVVGLFPFDYIHVGGGDVAKDCWKDCSFCQARIEAERLEDETGLQRYFVTRINALLAAHNRKMIGKAAAFEGQTPADAVTAFSEDSDAAKAAQQGHDVILTSWRHFRFDSYQGNPARQPLAVRGTFLPTEQVYRSRPYAGFSDSAKDRLLGVQAEVKTDWMRTPKDVDYRVWPRACALAEAAWTATANRDFSAFQQRLDRHSDRLVRYGINVFKERDITKPENALRVMTYNVLYGGKEGHDYHWAFQRRDMGLRILKRERMDKIVSVIRDVNPDIAILTECNDWHADNNKILNEAAEQLGMYGAVTSNRNRFKLAVLSKFPLSNIRWLDDDFDTDPFAHNILFADITLDNGLEMTVASLHYGWWGDPQWRTYQADAQKETYIKQYSFLLDVMSQYADKPAIFGGDFNHSPEDTFFGQAPMIQKIKDMGYTDTCLAIYRDYSQVISGTQRGAAKTGPIDYVFTSPAFPGRIVDADIVYSMEAFETSDHLPVWADIILEPTGQAAPR